MRHLTKVLNNIEALYDAYTSRFKEVENRLSSVDKKIIGVEDVLRKISEKSYKILKTFVEHPRIIISKLENTNQEKYIVKVVVDKDTTFHDALSGRGIILALQR